MKPHWFSLSADQQNELGLVVPTSRWHIIPRVELPSVFPATFRERIDSAIVVSTPTSTGGVYLAYCANRVDLRTTASTSSPWPHCALDRPKFVRRISASWGLAGPDSRGALALLGLSQQEWRWKLLQFASSARSS
jgi:hypothetical protein